MAMMKTTTTTPTSSPPDMETTREANTETDTHQLTAITCIAELQELRNLYLQNWPEHCVGFYTLDNFVRWLQKEPKMKNVHIYTLNGDWKSEGLFLIVDRYQLFVNSLCSSKTTTMTTNANNNNNNNALLTKAISLLNWNGGFKVSSFLERHRSAVVSVVRALHLHLEYDSLTLLYFLRAEEAAKLDVTCPPGFVLRPLSTLKDAATVDALWPNRHQGSLFLLQRLIAWNLNVGVYVEDTDELVAWCLRLQGGFLGALQVKDSHKRLGLGSLVTRAIASRLARELGHDVMALVNKVNAPSRRLFDKLGFRVTDTAYWLRTRPIVAGRDEWPHDE